jgi:hypothetical protein
LEGGFRTWLNSEPEMDKEQDEWTKNRTKEWKDSRNRKHREGDK